MLKVINKFCGLKKLSTLKRSCQKHHFALKHSWFCAETLLPLYIYLYLPVYKTSIRQLKIVDNLFWLFKKGGRFTFLLLLTSSLLACCKKPTSIYIPEHSSRHLIITQRPATKIRPAQFYVCEKGRTCPLTGKKKRVRLRPEGLSLNKRKKKHEIFFKEGYCDINQS